MSGISNYCFSNLPPHEQVLCNAYKRGGIDALILINTDAGITDYSSAAQINAALAASTARKVSGIKAEFPAGTPVKTENMIACGPDEIIDALDYEISFTDPNVSENNDEFWATANGRTFWVMLHLCNENEVLVIEYDTTVTASQRSVPRTHKEKQSYAVTLNFSTDPNEQLLVYTEPAGVF